MCAGLQCPTSAAFVSYFVTKLVLPTAIQSGTFPLVRQLWRCSVIRLCNTVKFFLSSRRASHRVLEFSSLFMAALCNRAGHIYFHPVVSYSFFFFLSFFSSPNLSGRRLDVYHTYTWCGLSANLEYRSETCCARFAENTGRKKSPKSRHLGIIP